MFAYCLNNPVNRVDDGGCFSLSNLAKCAIGAVATVAAVAVTVVTGGTMAPVIAGVAASAILGGAAGYVTGGKEGMIDGFSNGLMMGGLSAFGGSLISAGIRAIKTARQGITIGRNMSKGFANVNNAAGLTDTLTYSKNALWKPLNDKYYYAIKRLLGSEAADKASCFCNKIYIKTMKALGAVIYDSGMNGATEVGIFYAMELRELAGYANLITMY